MTFPRLNVIEYSTHFQVLLRQHQETGGLPFGFANDGMCSRIFKLDHVEFTLYWGVVWS